MTNANDEMTGGDGSTLASVLEKTKEDIPFEVLSKEPAPGSCMKVEVKVDKPYFDEKTEAALEEFKDQVSIPGFRRGKAPVKLIRNRFLRQAREEAMRQFAPRLAKQVGERENLEVLSEPGLEKWDPEGAEGPVLTIILEVRPEINVEGSVLEGLSVEVTENPVTDETVSEELEGLRRNAAVYAASEDGTFEEHDALAFTFTVTEEDGTVVDHVTEERYSEDLARDFPDDVVKALVGAGKGDSVSVEGVEVPHGDHTHKHNYLVNIHELKKRSLPELDDEFAKDVSEDFESLDALMAHIRKDLEEAEKNRKRAETLNEIYTELDKRVEFDLPDSMVRRLASRSIQRAEQNLAQYGMTLQQLGRQTVDNYIEQAMSEARGSVKALLIADQIGRLWGVEASEEDVQKELDRIAEAQGRKALAIRAALEKNNQFEDFKADLRIRSVNDRLIDRVEVKIVEKKDDVDEAEATPTNPESVEE